MVVEVHHHMLDTWGSTDPNSLDLAMRFTGSKLVLRVNDLAPMPGA